MVAGFESFREHFKGYEDCYTIIGGTACDILMSEAAVDFRATKDIDMIVLIENRFEEFASLFWEYIKKGEYRCGWKKSDVPHFYRFTEPKTKEYPKMIELFSRRPDFQLDNVASELTPLPVSDEISSLSAIMLDDNYYSLMLEGRDIIDGVSVLKAEYLILFKAKAWLDLKRRKAEGIHVNDKDLRKHKNDVFRLYSIVEPEAKIVVSEAVKEEMDMFISAMRSEEIRLHDLHIEGITLEDLLDRLKEMFITK